MTEQNVVAIEHLDYKAGNRYLLKDITWHIDEGENWLLFGLNGCGKTTLLSIIAGYKAAMSGSVRVFGKAYDDHWQMLRKQTAWISSSFFDRYYTCESVLQIVLSGKSATFGLDTDIQDADIQKAQQLLDALHMTSFIDRPYHMLSKGERQNVLIARAMMNEASLFLLDEPCSGLDVVARERMLQIICSLAERKDVTIIYVTHYAEEIPRLFSHALFLRDGRIYAKGETKQLFSSTYLSALLEAKVESFWIGDKLQLKFS